MSGRFAGLWEQFHSAIFGVLPRFPYAAAETPAAGPAIRAEGLTAAGVSAAA